MKQFSHFVRSFFRAQIRVHQRDREVANLVEAIQLVDRFVDAKLKYGLEWDDFISWKHADQKVEELRLKIADLEPQLFSADQSVRVQALESVIEIRDLHALLVGVETRRPTRLPQDAN
jgi:hypothetical protein